MSKGPNDQGHVCHARGCTVPVKPEMLMCLKHWRRVPKVVQRAVWANYRRGQCDDKRPSREWMTAADAAIGSVARKEGRQVSPHEHDAMVELDIDPITGTPGSDSFGERKAAGR